MARKTFNVDELRNLVNRMCKDSVPENAGIRQGAMLVLEQVLHDTGNYRGFCHLHEGECTGNPGINYLDNRPHPDYLQRFANTDPTRVIYY